LGSQDRYLINFFVLHMILDSSVLKQVPEQIASNVGEEVVILNFASGTYYGLNEIGAKIWHLIQHSKTVSQIYEAVLAEYDVEPERCRHDVEQLLQQLLTAGLIEVEHEVAT
jgi:hypothetical protein